MTARATWKAWERTVAKRLRGTRIPVTGQDAGGPDVVSDLLAVQVKLGQRLPNYLAQWLGNLEQWLAGRQPARTPLVVWRPVNVLTQDALVVMRLGDFERLLALRVPASQEEP